VPAAHASRRSLRSLLSMRLLWSCELVVFFEKAWQAA
jgi:hypothetical protein